MASHELIDAQVATLARLLPGDTVEELADGLAETWHHHVATGLTPEAAARAAITDFGTPAQISAAFVAQSPGRRLAVPLLISGPVVGACWAATLITTKAWTWPLPATAAVILGVVMLLCVAALIVAVTTAYSYRRTRLGTAGGVGLVVLDGAMVAVVLALGVQPAWPLALAVAASLTRATFTLRALPRAWAR